MKTINSTLFVNNMSQACLYDMEVLGQISDGRWENSRPYNHWTWVCHTDIALSNINGYNGVHHTKRYGVKNLFNDFMKYGEKWPMRMYYYAKYGTLLDSKWINHFGEMRYFIEMIGFDEDINTLEDLKNKTPEYAKSYWEDEYDEIFSTENIQKFRTSTYSIQDMKNDLKQLHESINTFLN